MKSLKKFNVTNKLLISQCFFSYWKKLFCLFAIPLMIVIVFLSFFEGTKNELREKNYESQEFFEVYYNFNSVFDEINKNYTNLIGQSELENYVINVNENNVILNNVRNDVVKLFSNSVVSMQYMDAVHFYCFENNYVVSTKNGNKIEDFYNRKFYEKYLQTKNPINITHEEGNDFLHIPETINFCYGYYHGTTLKGLIVYSINAHKLKGELLNKGKTNSHNIVLTNFEDFFYSSGETENSKEYYTDLAESLPFSEENNINIEHFENKYAFKAAHQNIPLTLLFIGNRIESGTFFNVWFLVFMLLFINIIVIITSIILTWQLREQLINITIEFLEQFSLSGEFASDFATVSQNIFDNLQRGEKLEIAFPRQLLNLRKTQLYALQMQLSPHFMYNTLNSINLMVMNLTKSDNDISKLIVLLSELLYDVLDTKKYIVTLKKEIEYSKKFLEIENIKRKKTIEIIWDVEKELLGCGVIKFIMQPVLENIFRHAFRSLQEQKTVRICVKSCENGYTISVEDNGMGIAPEKLDEIRKALDGEAFEGRHIGLVNVNKRIQMLFGSDYGIKIFSTVDVGTTVKIFLPRINKSEEQ